MQQAVLEFDEEVLAPWRPALRSVTGMRRVAPLPRSRPERRVTPVRPVVPALPVAPTRRPAPVRPSLAGAAPRPSAGGGGSPRCVAGPRDRGVRGDRAASGPRAARLRLTRRAHLLLALLLLAVGVAVGSWLGPVLGGGSGDLRLAGESSVVVEPGDTLWSIARSAAGDDDVRVVVAEIRELNGLTGVDLQPGQVLRLP